LALAGNLVTGTGDATIAGAAVIAGNIDGKGAIIFGGTADIDGAFDASGNVTFNGTTGTSTVAGVFTAVDDVEILGDGKVTFEDTVDTSSKTVTIKNTGGVTLTAENTIATDLTVVEVVITGSTSDGVILDETATDITVNASESIEVSIAGSIVAGDSTGKVVIKGALLGPGTYEAADADTATLTLSASTAIEVKQGGSVTIPGDGQIVFTDDTSTITLLAGGSLIASEDGDFIGTSSSDQTDVTLTVTADGSTATEATVDEDSGIFTVTTGTGGGADEEFIIGKIAWEIPQTGSDADGLPGTAATPAAGTLTAGTGTTIIIAGTT
jgi:hypothetical protein